MKQTIRGELVALQEGIYINYVFKNLDVKENDELRYLTLTRCPNWQYFKDIKIHDRGFVSYEYVEAGEKYLELTSNTEKTYKYTAYYFMNFVPEKEEDNIKEFKF